MDWYLLCWLFPMISTSVGKNSQKYGESNMLSNKLRRFQMPNPYGTPMLQYPRDPEDLPRAEPMHPGHSLLRPARNTLKSAAKFPHTDHYLVYGNPDNLGITYGKTSSRVKYSDFRKTNMMLDSILDSVVKAKNFKNRKSPLIVLGPFSVKRFSISQGRNMLQNKLEQNASEIWDGSSDAGSLHEMRRSRKKNKKKKAKHRDRKILRDGDINKIELNITHCSDSSSSSSSEDEVDKNKGNPYTILKSKYKQNWMWNFEMDGNHMNINPYGPEFAPLGPSGADLFYGRKWWYFNQDDYVPLG